MTDTTGQSQLGKILLYFFHLSNIFFIQHFNFPTLCLFFFFSPEPSEQSLCTHLCFALFWWENTFTWVPPAQWGSPHWYSPGTITTLSSWPVNVQMWKCCVREGFKCGSSTEGSWSTQNKAQQPSRINEKPSQLMLFASMIPSKRAFLQLNIFKEANGSCLKEFDCSFHCTQSLLNIIYLLAVIRVLFHFPRKSCRIRSLQYLYEKHWCSKPNL